VFRPLKEKEKDSGPLLTPRLEKGGSTETRFSLDAEEEERKGNLLRSNHPHDLVRRGKKKDEQVVRRVFRSREEKGGTHEYVRKAPVERIRKRKD